MLEPVDLGWQSNISSPPSDEGGCVLRHAVATLLVACLRKMPFASSRLISSELWKGQTFGNIKFVEYFVRLISNGIHGPVQLLYTNECCSLSA